MLTASTIDHIMIRKDNLHFVEHCCVAEDHGDNLSYRLPIFLYYLHTYGVKDNYCIKPKPCLSWKTIQNQKILCRYQKRFKENAEKLTSTMLALNSSESVEQTTLKITELLKQAAFKTIPQSSKLNLNLTGKMHWIIYMKFLDAIDVFG